MTGKVKLSKSRNLIIAGQINYELKHILVLRKNVRAAIDCLRKSNSTDMVYKEWDGITVGLTIGIFTPIIDGSFLDEKPAVALKKKEFKKTNILIGANKDEGFFFIFYYLSEMFQRQEDVFISRDAFERSITELNVYANPLQRDTDPSSNFNMFKHANHSYNPTQHRETGGNVDLIQQFPSF